MSKPKTVKGDGYPFDTGHWDRWSNVNKLAWLMRFRDQLRENNNALARKYDISEASMKVLDADVDKLEEVVVYEDIQAIKAKLVAAKSRMRFAEEMILRSSDKTKPFPAIIPPNLKLGKKGN